MTVWLGESEETLENGFQQLMERVIANGDHNYWAERFKRQAGVLQSLAIREAAEAQEAIDIEQAAEQRWQHLHLSVGA